MEAGPHKAPNGVRTNVPLAAMTTLGVGGPAAFYVEAGSAEQAAAAVAWARGAGLPVTVLGGGSNVVVHDAGLPGLVLRLQPQAYVAPAQGTRDASVPVDLVVPGGADWAATALHTAQRGLYGIACLAGIPGQVGAAPVQNIGAYGQELADVLTAVQRLHLGTGALDTLPAAALGLGYRRSHFRGAWRGQYLITAVHLRLHRRPGAKPLYPALAQALAAAGLDADAVTPAQLAQQVLALRRARGMVWEPHCPRSVGSFFVNPQLPLAQAQALMARLGPMPHWPGPHGTKLSAAWLIEAAGMARGWRCEAVGNRVGLSPLHALALVNAGGASAQDVIAAAQHIHGRVLAHSGVSLAAEARPLGFAALPAPFADA